MNSSDLSYKKNNSAFNRTLSVGIIGVGDVVAKSHLPVLLELEDVSVDWVTDINDQLAKRVADNYGIKWLPMPANLINLPYTDIVLLAIPYGARDPYYRILRDRETAIYVEKPVARTAVEHKQLNSDFSPSKFAVGFQRRSLGTVLMLKEMVSKGVFGQLEKVQFRHGGSANVLSGKAFSSDATLAGGGVLFEHGCHGLDLALFITGAKSAKSYRVHTILDKDFDVHAEGRITLTNSLCEFDLDFKVSWLTETGEGLTFYFANAVVYMPMGKPEIIVKSCDGKTLFSLTDSATLYPMDGFQSLAEYWRSFLSAIQTGVENHTTLNSFLLTTHIIEQVYARKVDK
jgi:predicted dehydrogenase